MLESQPLDHWDKRACYIAGKCAHNPPGQRACNPSLGSIGDHQWTSENYLIGYPGSAHDMQVFKESALLERLHNGDIAPYQIVGDAAYPLREYCLTPLHAPRGEDLMDDWAQCFNYCQSATRMVVERCIGAFKGGWRIFGGRNDCRLWRILAGAACCVILHNLCEEMAVVRRKNMAWFNLPRNRDSWWTRGAIATHKVTVLTSPTSSPCCVASGGGADSPRGGGGLKSGGARCTSGGADSVMRSRASPCPAPSIHG
ncbi:unnamed protein product [Closterium sp. NIES-54]